MTDDQPDIYAETMQGLAAWLTVGHIATFDLQTCADVDEGARVFGESSLEIYDQIPVQKSGPDRWRARAPHREPTWCRTGPYARSGGHSPRLRRGSTNVFCPDGGRKPIPTRRPRDRDFRYCNLQRPAKTSCQGSCFCNDYASGKPTGGIDFGGVWPQQRALDEVSQSNKAGQHLRETGEA